MLPLILRCVAVYGATAAALLWLAHRFVTPIRRRTAILLACAPLLFTGRATFTGAVYGAVDILYNAPPFEAHRERLRVAPVRSPSLGDIVYQHIPWRAAVRRAWEQGEAPLWNPGVLAGEPLLAVQQPGILQPGAWIGLLLPMPQAWTFDMTLRFLIALLCAYLYVRELGCGELPSLLAAAGWAFSDYFVFFLGFPNSAAMAPFPLALLGARRVVRQQDGRAVAILVLALSESLVAGHPETVLHTGAATGLYFLFELARAGPGRRSRALVLALLSVGLTLGLCAVVLLPLAEALPLTAQHHSRKTWYAFEKRSVPWAESLFRLVPQLVPYAVGVDGHGSVKDGFVVPSAYAGTLLFPFAFAGVASRRREAWFFLGLGLLSLSVCVKTFAADLITKLPFFDIAINEYLIILATFCLCVLAALGADSLGRPEGRRALWVGALLTLAGISALYRLYAPLMKSLGMSADFRRERLLLQLVPLLAGVGAAALWPRRIASLGLPAVLSAFLVSRVLEAGKVNPVLPAETFYPPLPVLSRIPRGTPDRMTALGMSFIPNASAAYGLEDVRGYEAMTLAALSETFPIWSIQQGFWFNRIDNPATPLLAFLNVRWVLTPPDSPVPAGWPVVAEADGLRLLENPRALARVFVPRFLRGEPDSKKRLALLGEIRDFGEQGLLSVETGSRWVENGRARVTIDSYRAQSLGVTVEAETPALVGTSIPGWPGWRVKLDGKPIASVPFNHAFLAFRVPAGCHRVTARYAPDGFRNGAAISLATGALGATLLLRRRRRSP
jgi:hypothetical protein